MASDVSTIPTTSSISQWGTILGVVSCIGVVSVGLYFYQKVEGNKAELRQYVDKLLETQRNIVGPMETDLRSLTNTSNKNFSNLDEKIKKLMSTAKQQHLMASNRYHEYDNLFDHYEKRIEQLEWRLAELQGVPLPPKRPVKKPTISYDQKPKSILKAPVKKQPHKTQPLPAFDLLGDEEDIEIADKDEEEEDYDE